MKSFRILSCVLSTSLILATSVRSADKEEPKKVPPRLAEILTTTPEAFIHPFDTIKDGVLTRDAVLPFPARGFDRADRNGDCKLDKQEGAQMLQVLRQRMTASENAKKLEAKGAEVDQLVNQMLERMDTNKDGKI